MPHELHQTQIRAKSLVRDAETDNLSIDLGGRGSPSVARGS